MDKVKQLLEEIGRLPQLSALGHAANSLLNAVGDIYERRGPVAARVYLLNQGGGSRTKPEVPLLLEVVRLFEGCETVREDRAIGRQIIKTLLSLKREARDDSRAAVSNYSHDRGARQSGRKR